MKHVFLILWCSTLIFAQTDLLKQDAELNSAKADLEDARKARDQVVAARWQDRKTQNEERENWMSQLQDAKSKLDALAQQKDRLFEEIKATREDVARQKQEAENERQAFFARSDLSGRSDALQKMMQQGAPFNIPQRIQQLNALEQSLRGLKDNPGHASQLIFNAALQELALSRQVKQEQAELIFNGKESVRGERLRLGLVGGVQYAPTTRQAALLLPQAGEKGRIFVWQTNLTPSMVENIGKNFFAKSDSNASYWPLDVLLSTTLSSQISETTEEGWQESFTKWMKDGGFLMYPIVGLGVLALLLMVERLIVLAIRGRYNRQALRQILEASEKGQIEDAKRLAEDLQGSMGRVVRAIFRNPQGGRASAEKALEEVFIREVPALERRLGTISVLGASAPLLGLLGTVMGMIQLFEIITLYGTNDPKMLAGGIAVALITTEGGLMVAIPVQLLHSWVSNRVDALVNRLESTSVQLMNILWIQEKP